MIQSLHLSKVSAVRTRMQPFIISQECCMQAKISGLLQGE